MIKKGTESNSHSAVRDEHNSSRRCYAAMNEMWLHKPQTPQISAGVVEPESSFPWVDDLYAAHDDSTESGPAASSLFFFF